MVVLLRYAFLLVLGFVSVFALVSATTVGGQMILAEAGHSAESQGAMMFWAVAALAGFSLFSMIRTVLSGPSRLRLWLHYNRGRMYTLLLGALVCAVFLVT